MAATPSRSGALGIAALTGLFLGLLAAGVLAAVTLIQPAPPAGPLAAADRAAPVPPSGIEPNHQTPADLPSPAPAGAAVPPAPVVASTAPRIEPTDDGDDEDAATPATSS